MYALVNECSQRRTSWFRDDRSLLLLRGYSVEQMLSGMDGINGLDMAAQVNAWSRART